MKEKFDVIQSTCIPIEIDNNNTDNIIPARYLAFTTRDPKFYGDAFMHDLRYDANNQPRLHARDWSRNPSSDHQR